ncbi:MAG: NAD(P)/FAD-dependent oxidoreductase [Cryomorphaceae bacterium]|nr:NAD(P)/FAD-dependent oxidoreductase [Cryomorphaceae bacterium]
MNIPDTEAKRIVVIGGGFGGIRLISKLKNAGFQLVLLDKNNYHTFQPLLYQVATAGLEPGSIAYPLRKMFLNHPNFYFRVAEVEQVMPEQKTIETNIGSLSYDYLVIATGSTTNYFGIDGMEKVAMPMKSVNEALDLRSVMLQMFERALLTNDEMERRRLMNFVIVGAGPTGVELAGALSELKSHVLPKDYPDLDMKLMEVRLIEAGSRVLAGMSESSSRKARRYLEKMGVKVMLNTFVKQYDGHIVTTNHEEFYAGKLIWAAGVRGNVPEGFPVEVIRGGRLRTDEYSRVKGFDSVFALGDVAFMETDAHPNGHPQVAPVAIQQGSHLAENLKCQAKGQALLPFVYKDKGSMATVGKNKAVVDFYKFQFGGFLGWWVWMFVHLMSLVGFRNKVVTLMNWVWNYINYEHGVRLITRPIKYRKTVPAEK